MAVFAVSITKSMVWRGKPAEFSNVYHYETSAGQVFQDAEAMAELVRLERLVHSSFVTFVKGRTWGPTENRNIAESVTRTITDFTGTGSLAPNATMYRECAILVKWPLGRYGRFNRPQYLRKWLHTLANHGYDVSGADRVPSTSASLQQYIDGVRNLVPAVGAASYGLCQDTGINPIGPGTIYPYLEHRQLGR